MELVGVLGLVPERRRAAARLWPRFDMAEPGDRLARTRKLVHAGWSVPAGSCLVPVPVAEEVVEHRASAVLGLDQSPRERSELQILAAATSRLAGKLGGTPDVPAPFAELARCTVVEAGRIEVRLFEARQFEAAEASHCTAAEARRCIAAEARRCIVVGERGSVVAERAC